MNRFQISALLVLVHTALFAQQTPQYPMVLPPGTNIDRTGHVEPFNQGSYQRTQSIYYPSEFPNAPHGLVTDIFYLKGSFMNNFQPDSIVYTNLYIGAKSTSAEVDSLYIPGCVADTVASWLTTDTLFYQSKYTIYGPIDSGDWVRFHLQKPFHYDGHSFIIDIFSSSQTATYPYGISTQCFAWTNYPHCREVSGQDTSNPPKAGVNPFINIIGLNIQPLSVASVDMNSDILLYPNPSQGVFMIEVKRAVGIRSVQVDVKDITGKAVYSRTLNSNNGSFKEHIDLTNLLSGVYFAEVRLGNYTKREKLIVVNSF